MSKENNIELAKTMDKLLISFVKSLSKAALEVDKTFDTGEFKSLPMKYTIPKMSIDMKLSLMVEKGAIKGVFRKRKSSSSQELLSTVSVDVVAIPKNENL